MNRFKKFDKLSRQSVIFWSVGGVLLILLFVLSILFPQSGDDWYWGSRSFTWAEISAVNGRYAGTVVAMLMSRFDWVKAVFTTAAFVALVYFLAKYVGKKNILYVLFATLLLLALPLDIFRQAVVWSSGFANYFPSVLIIVAYIYLIRNIFSEKLPEYKPYLCVVLFVLGVLGGLFVENMTIGNIVIAVAVVIYTAIRFKKIKLAHIAFLIGSVVGAVIMFTNGAYFSIVNGSDETASGYRTLFFGAEMLERMKVTYTNFIAYLGFFKNVWLNLSVCVFLIAISVRGFQQRNLWQRILLVLFSAYEIGFLCISFADHFGWISSTPFRLKIYALATALFVIVEIVHMLFVVKNIEMKLNILFLFGCVAAYMLPLLVVDPIGPRNFFATYILQLLMAVILLDFVLREYRIPDNKKIICILCIVAAVCLIARFICFFIVYGAIHAAYVERAASISEQLIGGNGEIVISQLPFADYVWVGNPYDGDTGYFTSLFKLMYDIPEDVVLILK